MSADPLFTVIAQDAFLADIRTLVAALAARDWQPTAIVGIGRGGLVPAVYLSHATGLPMLSCDWSGGLPAVTDDAPARLAAATREGARLLLVDDINDSGGTLGALCDALAAADAVVDAVRTAVLIDNIRSTRRVDYRACTIDRTVTKDWFVFPWETLAPAVSLAGDAAAVPSRIG